jgi:perosamine synthetase
VIYQIKPTFEKSTIKNVKKYLDSKKWITEHIETKKFEKEFSKYTKAKYCVTFPNGTLTMSSILSCLDIKEKDEVLVSNYTMIATANVASFVGAKLVLVDISTENLCMCPMDLKKRITKNSKYLIYTSINGRLGYIDEIKKICKKNKIIFLEDAAHSIGSFKNGRHSGTFGLAGSFSFSMPKLITMGQGGAVVTNNKILARKLRFYKDFGRKRAGEDIHSYLGYNFKITDIQSVLALGQLNNIKNRVKIKKRIYRSYYNYLHKNKNIKIFPPKKEETVWSTDIYLKNPKTLQRKLNKVGIRTRLVYPAINSQKIYKNFKGLKNSNYFCNRG